MSYFCRKCGTIIEEDDTDLCGPCSRPMTKTTGERIVEEWIKPAKPIFSGNGKYDDTPLSDLARRIDEALLTTMATAEGEVERLRETLLLIRARACTLIDEALDKKEG